MKGLVLLLTLLMLLFSLNLQAQNDVIDCADTAAQHSTEVCENTSNNDNKAMTLIVENKDVATLTLIILACFCALLSQAKGRRPALWFVLALVFHFIAVIVLLCLRDLSGKKQLSE